MLNGGSDLQGTIEFCEKEGEYLFHFVATEVSSNGKKLEAIPIKKEDLSKKAKENKVKVEYNNDGR